MVVDQEVDPQRDEWMELMPAEICKMEECPRQIVMKNNAECSSNKQIDNSLI